jgi:SAM-dependent methyltransferase
MPSETGVSRRSVLRLLIGAVVLASSRRWLALAAGDAAFRRLPSNFKSIYSAPETRREFPLFLRNVFNLYPEDRFDQLIAELTGKLETDGEIYRALAARLPEITPRLSSFRYALPALRKQKREMADETVTLLGERRKAVGYVEIGTTGRYLGTLRKQVDIRGLSYVVNDAAPIYSLEDIIERGQVRKAGNFVSMGDYDEFDRGHIPEQSVELVTNYIGFHHAPKDKLEGFVVAVARILKPGGRLIVRDHDVDGPRMDAMVGLAHDVFNAGVGIPWDRNEAQVRNFRSVADLAAYLEPRGLRRLPPVALQEGDPTRNTLLIFEKTAPTSA